VWPPGGVIAAAGIAVLSQSPVVLAEEGRESQAAGPPGDPTPVRQGGR
jgi:hypothetical protein